MAIPKGKKTKRVTAVMGTSEGLKEVEVKPVGKEKSLAERFMPVMMVLILVMAFGLGAMWNKLQNGSGSGKGKYKTFEEAVKDLGKKAGVKDQKKLLACMNSGDKKSVVDADAGEGTGLGVNGTPAFFINGRLIPGAVPLAEFKKVLDQELGTAAMDISLERKTVNVGGAPTRGEAAAAIKMVEYSDFQCPFCAQAYPTVQQILKDYSGKVQLAYKHFPLTSIHPRAQKAAEASECAKDQGRFWEFHDKLFENQKDWANL